MLQSPSRAPPGPAPGPRFPQEGPRRSPLEKAQGNWTPPGAELNTWVAPAPPPPGSLNHPLPIQTLPHHALLLAPPRLQPLPGGGGLEWAAPTAAAPGKVSPAQLSAGCCFSSFSSCSSIPVRFFSFSSSPFSSFSSSRSSSPGPFRGLPLPRRLFLLRVGLSRRLRPLSALRVAPPRTTCAQDETSG